jgi:Peptidase family S41
MRKSAEREGDGMLTRRATIIGLGSGLAAASHAWAAAPLTPADIGGDIAILRRAYETLHPGLYRYNTPMQIAAGFANLERAWSQPQSRSDAYLSLSRFLATIRCGHTYANFYNQTRAIAEELFSGRTRLPFQFVWRDGRMIVTKNLASDRRLAPGAEILSVNGRRAGSILRGLMPLVRADGHNDAKRVALLEVRGDDAYETFDVFHPMMFGPIDDVFRLRVRPGGGRATPVQVAPIDLAARRAVMRATPDRAAPLWTFTIDDGVGVLTMPSWAVYNSSWNWRGFLDDAFRQIDSPAIRGLVIDLRGNEGGNDCGNPIIARLIDSDVTLGREERRVRYRATPQDLDPFLDTWDDSFRNWGDDAVDIGGGFFRLRGKEEDGAPVNTIRPQGPRFRRPVIVLIDAQNSSATFQFAQTVKANGLGRLMGTPTGGNRRGINGGAFFFVRLPGSGLEADLPLIGRFPLTQQPDAGLEPDLFARPSIDDIATGRDGVMAAALATIRRT